MLKLEDILLSKKITKIINEEFCIFEAENFLPLEYFLELEKKFPENSFLESTTPENEKYNRSLLKFHLRDKLGESNQLTKMADSFFKDNKEWFDFIKLLADEKFIYDALVFFDKPTRDYRGFKYSFRKKRYINFKQNPTLFNKLINRLYNNISVNFMFTSTGPSEKGFFPHTDSTNKLITLLFYFPEKNWRKEFRGETSFYKLKSNVSQSKKIKWGLLGKKNTHIVNSQLSSEFVDDYELLYKSKYIPNMLAGFVKNERSWHGVDPLTSPKTSFRRVFIMNITM